MQVYRIFNKANNKSYIGITRWDFFTRYSGGNWHLWTHNKQLKNSVEKYGLDNFAYEILWNGNVDFDELIKLEKLYIEQYNSFIPNGYNLTKGGSKEVFTNTKEYELRDFYGNFYKVSNLSLFCKKQKINYSAMLNMVSGLSNVSCGFFLASTDISKIKNPLQEFILENILSGEVCTIQRKNIPVWAKEKNIKPKPIYCVLDQKTKSSQGWKLKDTKILNTKIKGRVFISPSGENVFIDNIYKFCKENNLDRGAFYKLIKKKHLSYKGWTVAMNPKEFQELKNNRRGIEVELIDPNGNIVKIKNISAFCREKLFNRNSIQALISGRTKKYNGYSLKK